MFTFVLIVHALTSLLLITIILLQSGRGGGLTESFAGVESIFGTKTNSFLVKTTTVLATIFLLTSVSLAALSTQRNRSLMEKEVGTKQNLPAVKSPALTTSDATKAETIPSSEANQLNQRSQGNIAPEKDSKQTK